LQSSAERKSEKNEQKKLRSHASTHKENGSDKREEKKDL
jgi:hypothetical protein